MMKMKVMFLFVTLVLVGGLVLGGCATATPTTEAPIVIGILPELTGPLAPAGIPGMQGATVGFEQGPKQIGGRTIKLVVEDSAGDPATALDKARKLVESDGACMIMMPLLGSSLAAVAPYIEKANVPGLAVEGQPRDLYLTHNWLWSGVGSQQQVDYGFGKFVYSELGYKTVDILAPEIADGPNWMEGFKLGFTESGGTVAQETYYPPMVDDFTPYLRQLKPADALMTFGSAIYIFNFYKAYAELNLTIPILECPGDTPSPAIQEALGDASIGVVFQSVYHYTIDNPQNKQFVDAFQKRWEELPNQIAGDCFMNWQLMMAALEKTKGNTSPDALAKALTGLSIDTVRGPVSFTPEHLATCNYYIYKIAKVNGQKVWVPLKMYTATSKKVGNTLVPSIVKPFEDFKISQ